MYAFVRSRNMRYTINRNSLFIAITVFITNITLFPAHRLSSSAAVIALQNMSPAYLMVMCMLFYHTRYTFLDFVLVAVSITGMLCIFRDADHSTMLGNIYAIISGISYASTQCLLSGKTIEERYSGMSMGHAMLLLCLPFVPREAVAQITISPSVVAAILFAGMIQVPVPNIAMSLAMSYTSPLACSIIATSEIFFNPFWVFLFLGELPSPLTLLGCVIIFASVVGWTIIDGKRNNS